MLGGCATSKMPTQWLEVEGHRVFVEVADNGERRALGLMNRDRLGKNRGMLFVYPEEAPRSFWMKNTRIPLSIAYIDAGGAVVSVHDMRPLSTRQTPSEGPAMYALEVNKGWFDERGIKAGAKVAGLPGPSSH